MELIGTKCFFNWIKVGFFRMGWWAKISSDDAKKIIKSVQINQVFIHSILNDLNGKYGIDKYSLVFTTKHFY